MTISIWRYGHMLLALSTSIFLLFATLTGLILAFEPMGEATQPYRVVSLGSISLGETMQILDAQYQEVISVEVDKNDFVLASVVNDDGSSETIYINPKTGEKLGVPTEKPKLFQFTTNLHRSLFLKSIGRFFVGLVSFLLCLIAVTGLFLLIQRQGGIQKLFSKVQKDGFERYYHVSLGRWMLLPVIIVAATGVYLSLEKFSLLPPHKLQHQLPELISEEMKGDDPAALPIFRETKLSQVRKLTYPFSEFPEDYFELTLKDKEVYVHQYTGDFLSERYYPFTAIALRWSMLLHTGQGSFWWSVVLVLVCLALLFFMYSGFVLWRKRTQTTKLELAQTDTDEASIILLVGSETGTTFDFAKVLHKALLNAGETVHVTELNSYSTYKNANQLVVLTATYGEGEATTNARNFSKLVPSIQQPSGLSYSVVGFGSLLYKKYCGFAIEVNQLLQNDTDFKELLPLYKINNQDFHAFQDWGKQWSEQTGIPLNLVPLKSKKPKNQPKVFTVVERTELNADHTFLLRLRPNKKSKFVSGDLAGIIHEDGMERQYSIAKIGGDILLSIKKHEHGKCSTYLSELSLGTTLPIHLKVNPHFHFPKNVPSVILIANGTGIAPYLGMLSENKNQIPVHLFYGLRTKKSFDLYNSYFNQNFVTSLELAISRSENKQYVQDVIQQKPEWFAQHLDNGATVMICGSLAMQNEVLNVLESLCATHLNTSLSEYENRGQLKLDCY